MPIWLLWVLLILLFGLLGLFADIMITNFRILGERLRISVFALGLVSGMLTSLPEFFIGLNAVLSDIPQVSFGNLMGGVMVLFGLISGLLIIAGNKISTTKLFQGKWLWAIGGFIVLPLFLATDGAVSSIDGLILIAFYILIINGLLSSRQQERALEHIPEEDQRRFPTKKVLAFAFSGIVGVVVVAHYVITVTLDLAKGYDLPLFFTGLIIFAVGTNLPELSVSLTAWKAGMKRLGLGNVLGSAFTNALVVGVLAQLKPIVIRTSPSFWIFFVIFLILVFLYIAFGLSGHKYTRREGIVLLALYVVFLLSELSSLSL